MRFLRRNTYVLAGLAIMLGLSLFAWSRLDAPLPVHWGINGEPDRFGTKLEALFLMPAITFVVYLLVVWIPRLDKSHQRNAKILELTRGLLVFTMTVIHVGVVLGYLGAGISVPRLVMLALGVQFLLLGNQLPKVQPSASLGVRTVWALTSKKSWYKTQRAGAWVFVLTGLAMLISGLLTDSSPLFFSIIVAMLVGIVAVVVYSYLVWRSDEQRESAL